MVSKLKFAACCVAAAFAFASLGGFPNGGKVYVGGGSGPVGVLATPAQTFVNSIGFVTHRTLNGADTTARIIADMNTLGVFNIRDFVMDNTTAFGVMAAAHAKFDVNTSAWNSCSGTSTATILAAMTAALDPFIGLYPSALPFIDGQNEINNFPPCYLITAVATGSSSAVVDFTATPASVLTTATAGYGSGIVVTDVTTPANIPGGTTVLSATSTTVTLSASTTVAGSDVIHFEANGTNPASGLMWQVDIYNTVHADAHLTGMAVANFTDYPNYGVIGTADKNSCHPYATYGSQPGNLVSGWQFLIENGQCTTISGLPLLATETGWASTNSGTDGVDVGTQAIYSLNALFDLYTAFNVPQTYFYELINDGVTTGLQDNFGLFNNANAIKPAGTAVKNLVSILLDNGGSFSPGRLNYSISGLSAPSGSWPTGNAGGYSALFQKSNGNYYIVIWNEPRIWNETTQTPITPSSSSLTVNFGLTAATVNVYDPISSTTPISTVNSVSSISPSIAADPLIVEIIPLPTYAVTPPPYTANLVSSPSLPFTVMLGSGTFSGAQTITISDGGAGGTITPSVGSPGTSTVVVTPTVSTSSFTFTYAGSTAGTKTISFGNAQGWHDPLPLSYFSANPIAPYDGTVWNNPGTFTPCTGCAHGTFHSNLLNTTIGYVIYTPPGYPIGGPFPVVYVFPGTGSDENAWTNFPGSSGTIYAVVQAAILATTIKPMILVTVMTGTSNDNRNAQPGSPDYGTFPPQAMFINEAIPFIDATYSTIANKTGRALHGFSMGGQAVMRYATKFPQMFSSVYGFAPASDDVAPNYPICPPGSGCSDVTSSEPVQLAALFSNNTAAWQNDSVWGSGAYNAPNINGLPIHVTVGGVDSLQATEVDYYTLLDDAGVAHDALSVAPGCGHDYWCDTTFVGNNAPWIFASTHFP